MFGLNNNTIFGLDIGFETLKLVQLSQKKDKRINLVGSIEIPLTERILEHDHFKNKAQTANLIIEACRNAKPHSITAKKIVSALPETFVFSKTIQMPKMKEEEYKNAIPVEAAQYLPIPIENAYTDYQILMSHPEEKLVDILFVATPKKLVDDYVEMTKMAGLELTALETKPIAVGRAVKSSFKLDGVILVEIGTELSRISIWEENNIRLSTTVNTGKNQIKEALTSQRIDKDNLAAKSTVISIIDETLNAIKFHQNRDYKPKPVSQVLLCGSGANFVGIGEIFQQELKLKTNIFQPQLDNDTVLGTEYVTSFGLALRNENE